ncbi:hypothetical protein [Paraburkholderia fungorum]|uniref:hypothetical protein n=1 Tax=Paraburkholderia fungorum TaxID=134537 RepID=UPI0038B76193
MLLHRFWMSDRSGMKDLVCTGIAALLALVLSASAFGNDRQRGVKKIIVSTKGNNCPIRLTDPYGGDLTATRYVVRDPLYRESGLGEMFIQFVCLRSDDAETVRRIVFAKYDKQLERWEPDFSALSSRDLALVKPVTRRFALRATNSSGVGVTQDAINGDPETRDRSLGFCLRHPPVVLCGSVAAVARPYYSKVGLMPYVLTLLRSIEFVGEGNSETLPDRSPPTQRD